MGALFDYFAAATDADAAAALDFPIGPRGSTTAMRRRFGKSSRTPPVLDGTGVEPTVTLAAFEELLTGRSSDELLADPDPIVATSDGGLQLVVRVSDSFVRAVATAEAERLRELCVPWSAIEELHGEARPSDLMMFLAKFQSLCKESTRSRQHVYCWVCV